MFTNRGQFVYRSLNKRFWLQARHRLSGITQTKNQNIMKTNRLLLGHYFTAAALLLTLAGSLSACESTKPINPKLGDVHIMSPIVADTILVQPDDPRPTPIKPIHDPKPEEL